MSCVLPTGEATTDLTYAQIELKQIKDRQKINNNSGKLVVSVLETPYYIGLYLVINSHLCNVILFNFDRRWEHNFRNSVLRT